MNLKDLKLPKKSKAELKTMDAPCGSSSETYPYGTRITFDNELMAKFSALENAQVGDKVMLVGLAEVVLVRKIDRQGDKKKDYSVDLQIQQLGLDLGTKKPSTLIDSIEKSKKGIK
jgi:hypothetical protein